VPLPLQQPHQVGRRGGLVVQLFDAGAHLVGGDEVQADGELADSGRVEVDRHIAGAAVRWE
jgi:hypothetical protein